MKNKVYLHVYKTQLIRSFTYKFEVYGNILIQTIIMLANAFFWRALFKNTDTIKGVNVDTMLTYTVVSSLISVVLTTTVERRIQDSVKKGTVAIDYIRPVNIYKVYFAENLANITGLAFQNLLPIFIIGSLIIKIPKPASLLAFVLFLLSLCLAFALNWLIAVCFGMWAFWVLEIDAMLQAKKHLIRLLSGSLIPIWFFSGWLKGILQGLPFMYLYQLPLDLFIGKTTGKESLQGFMVQLLWLVIMFAFYTFLKSKVKHKIVVQGG